MYIAFLVAIAAVAAGALWYTKNPSGESAPRYTESNWGAYAYTCDKGVEFIMTPAADVLSITIEPTQGMSFPPKSTLADSPTDTGRRFRNADLEFHGQGESVTLYSVKDDIMYTCAPQPKPDEPPFNWGD